MASSRGVVDHSDQLQDFYDTACVISQLDLVISVDTAVTHLAGALDVPVGPCFSTMQISGGCVVKRLSLVSIDDLDSSTQAWRLGQCPEQIHKHLERLLGPPRLR